MTYKRYVLNDDSIIVITQKNISYKGLLAYNFINYIKAQGKLTKNKIIKVLEQKYEHNIKQVTTF